MRNPRHRFGLFCTLLVIIVATGVVAQTTSDRTYPIVDTGITSFYSDDSIINEPGTGDAFYGQDAHYTINPPRYTDNRDGTVTDEVTGLMWQQEMGNKVSFDDAFDVASASTLGGYADWRVPTLKELYSLILFTGLVSGERADEMFIDTDYFDQPIGDTSAGEREIDAQTWSATEYVGRTMRNDETVFGVNFVDGRIKGYPKFDPRTRSANRMYVRLVRGNESYGENRFIDNRDGTVSDLATGLQWQMADSGDGMTWEDALEYAEDLSLAGYSDWRLPNAKELQSIVDYTRSPQTTGSAALNPIFAISEIDDPDGDENYPYFWTSTTHQDGRNPYDAAVYLAFGEAQGEMNGRLLDVHGAGAQRSDPKTGRASRYPAFFGPQGDVQYVFNFVRAVRSLD